MSPSVSPGVLSEEQRIVAADGTELQLLSWAPEREPKATILVVHGYADHAQRYRELAHALARQGIATHAIDLRGHGGSAGRRGHVTRFEEYLADVDAAVAAIDAPTFFVVGHSMGAVVALDWLTRERRERVRGLGGVNPVLALGLPVPPWKLKLGGLAARVAPILTLPTNMDPAHMSRDPVIAESYRRDPLVFTTATAGWFDAMRTAQARVRQLREVPVPLLYVYSDADRVVDWRESVTLAEQLQSPDKTIWVRPGEYHEILNELDRQTVHANLAAWLLERA